MSEERAPYLEEPAAETGTLIHENATIRTGFTQILNTVVRRSDISMSARMLYVILCSYARDKNSCWPGYETICEDAGVKEDAVRRMMKELIAADLLETKRRGLGKTNLYILKDPMRAHVVRKSNPVSARKSDAAKSRSQNTAQARQEEEYALEEYAMKNTSPNGDAPAARILPTRKKSLPGSGSSLSEDVLPEEHSSLKRNTAQPLDTADPLPPTVSLHAHRDELIRRAKEGDHRIRMGAMMEAYKVVFEAPDFPANGDRLGPLAKRHGAGLVIDMIFKCAGDHIAGNPHDYLTKRLQNGAQSNGQRGNGTATSTDGVYQVSSDGTITTTPGATHDPFGNIIPGWLRDGKSWKMP